MVVHREKVLLFIRGTHGLEQNLPLVLYVHTRQDIASIFFIFILITIFP